MRDLGLRMRRTFQRARRSLAYRAAYQSETPLVTVCVATYNRAELLRRRAVASLLAQSYANIEILVVGDACTDATPEVMAAVEDPRLTFVNLPVRGDYPEDPTLRWMVAGTAPVNHALAMARGDFITHLDDDDEHSPDRIEKLVGLLKESRADLIWHPFEYEKENGEWLINKSESFRLGSVTTSSIIYHNWFHRIPWDPVAYRYREPGDWNRLRKFSFLGARLLRHPDTLLKHYKERNQHSR